MEELSVTPGTVSIWFEYYVIFLIFQKTHQRMELINSLAQSKEQIKTIIVADLTQF